MVLRAKGKLNLPAVLVRIPYMKYPAFLVIAAMVISVLLAACGSESTTPASVPPTASPSTVATPTAPTATQTTESSTMAVEEVETDWDGILGTTVLRPGTQRVAFLLTGARALVSVPEVEISTFYINENGSLDGPHETLTAGFNLWPYGTRGSYTTEMSFDKPGMWRLEITGEEEGESRNAIMEVEVTDGYRVVDIGQDAPASMNRIVADGAPLSELSSAYEPDPELYATRIADVVGQGRPTLVVFSTPSFCTSATCGPQVETVSQVRSKFKGQADFIHVEVYENPHEVQGDLTRARTSPIMDEWGLTSVPEWTNESWVFLMDGNGKVTARFEAFSTADELEAALQSLLS